MQLTKVESLRMSITCSGCPCTVLLDAAVLRTTPSFNYYQQYAAEGIVTLDLKLHTQYLCTVLLSGRFSHYLDRLIIAVRKYKSITFIESLISEILPLYILLRSSNQNLRTVLLFVATRDK